MPAFTFSGSPLDGPVISLLPTAWVGAAVPFDRDIPKPRSTVTLGQAVPALIAAKQAAGRRPIYVTGLRQYLEAFARGRETAPIASIGVDDLESWFAGRNEAPSGRASNVGRLSALFAYAQRRGWILDNPCRRLEAAFIPRPVPKILKVAEADRILRHATGCLRPWVVLGLFAGLRPTEAERMAWNAINLEDQRLVVDAAASKTARRRSVPLGPAACAWLGLDAKPSGPVVSSHSTLRRQRRRLSDELGIPWPPDVLRHSHASYAIASGVGMDALATRLGNSRRMLANHYVDVVSPRDAEAFWNLTP